jgi:hypothetical protein
MFLNKLHLIVIHAIATLRFFSSNFENNFTFLLNEMLADSLAAAGMPLTCPTNNNVLMGVTYKNNYMRFFLISG